MSKKIGNSPFIYDDSGLKIIGVSNPDGSSSEIVTNLNSISELPINPSGTSRVGNNLYTSKSANVLKVSQSALRYPQKFMPNGNFLKYRLNKGGRWNGQSIDGALAGLISYYGPQGPLVPSNPSNDNNLQEPTYIYREEGWCGYKHFLSAAAWPMTGSAASTPHFYENGHFFYSVDGKTWEYSLSNLLIDPFLSSESVTHSDHYITFTSNGEQLICVYQADFADASGNPVVGSTAHAYIGRRILDNLTSKWSSESILWESFGTNCATDRRVMPSIYWDDKNLNWVLLASQAGSTNLGKLLRWNYLDPSLKLGGSYSGTAVVTACDLPEKSTAWIWHSSIKKYADRLFGVAISQFDQAVGQPGSYANEINGARDTIYLMESLDNGFTFSLRPEFRATATTYHASFDFNNANEMVWVRTDAVSDPSIAAVQNISLVYMQSTEVVYEQMGGKMQEAALGIPGSGLSDSFNNRLGLLSANLASSDGVNSWTISVGSFTLKDANSALVFATGAGYSGAYKNILESAVTDNVAYWNFPSFIPGGKHHAVRAIFIPAQYSVPTTGAASYSAAATSVVVPCTTAEANFVGFSAVGLTTSSVPAGAYISSVSVGVSFTLTFPAASAGATINNASNILLTWGGSSQAYVMARFVDTSNCLLFGYRGTNYIAGSTYNTVTQNTDIVLRVISGGVVNDYPIVSDSTLTGVELGLEMFGSKACCYINGVLAKEVQITTKASGSFTASSGVNGTNTITTTTASATGLDIGQAITGTGIPASTNIYDLKTVGSTVTITLSNNLTATASGAYATSKGVNTTDAIMQSTAIGVGIRTKGIGIGIDGFCSYKAL